MTKRDRPAAGRRAFLVRGAALAGGTAAVVVAGGASGGASGAAGPAVAEDETVQGYRLTPHIERYYRLARR